MTSCRVLVSLVRLSFACAVKDRSFQVELPRGFLESAVLCFADYFLS